MIMPENTTCLPNDGLMLTHAKPRGPSEHKTFVRHLYNVGPTWKTLGRRCTNGIQMLCFFTVVVLYFATVFASELGTPRTY